MKQPTLVLSILGVGLLFVFSILYEPWYGPKKSENIVSVYTWAGTFDPLLLKEFEKETGIKVQMDFYESDETLEAKLLTGKSGYDLVMPSMSPYFGRQVLLKDRIFTPLDKTKLKNWKYLDESILKLLAYFDPDHTYGIPYNWGITVFAYDADKVKKIIKKPIHQSLSFLYDQSNAKKLSSCGIILLDYPQDLVESVLFYKNITPQYQNLEHIKIAQNHLESLRPYIRYFTSNPSRLVYSLLNKEACVVQMWSSEALKAQKEAKLSKNPINMKFIIPVEHQGAWCDLMVIPQGAPHLRNAYKFIDFMLRPDIAAKNSKYLLSPLANNAYQKYLPLDLKNNLLFSSQNVFKNLRVNEVLPLSFERRLTHMWTKIKLGHN